MHRPAADGGTQSQPRSLGVLLAPVVRALLTSMTGPGPSIPLLHLSLQLLIWYMWLHIPGKLRMLLGARLGPAQAKQAKKASTPTCLVLCSLLSTNPIHRSQTHASYSTKIINVPRKYCRPSSVCCFGGVSSCGADKNSVPLKFIVLLKTLLHPFRRRKG